MPISSRTKAVLLKLRHAAKNARRRCINPKERHYSDYGERGIEFRFESVASCVDYLLTLPGHYDLTLWIDRIDNDGHYEVGNIRFTTRSESQKNRRTSRPSHNKDSVVRYHQRHGFGKCFSRLIAKGVMPREVAELYCLSRNTVNRIRGRYN